MSKLLNIFWLVFAVLLGYWSTSCSLAKLPNPEELEQIFVGRGSKVIFVDPEQVKVQPIRVDGVLENGELCGKCHPPHSLDPDSIFRVSHITEYKEVKPCSDCHSARAPTKEMFPVSATTPVALIFSHSRHLGGRVACGQCHKIGVHSKGLRVSMLACLECHEKMKAPTSCSTCHPKWEEVMPEFHRGVNIIKTHGKVELSSMAKGGRRGSGGETDCNRCHVKPNFCIDCHGIEMPHPKNYLDRHNQEVKGKPETCVLCHGKNPCLACHQARGILGK